MDKPVVVNFIGYASAVDRVENVYFASSFDDAARLAVDLATMPVKDESERQVETDGFKDGQVYLRGLFSGGTLAYETLLILQELVPGVHSNVPLKEELRLADATTSVENSIVDLGEDEFTVGRLHPMMDNDLRIRRLEQEAQDPEVAVILLDVVLGHGAHPDPASELAPAIKQAIKSAAEGKRRLEVVAVVVGTDEDPQDMPAQVEQLEAAGAHVFTVNAEAARYVGQLVSALSGTVEEPRRKSVDLAMLNDPLSAINVGLESFAESLTVQETPVVHVDWRPPAGGNEQLMSILERMKSK
jgi:FdrA protein